MNIVLWAVQVLLALHTVMGAMWKFSHSEQTVPSLKALPHGAWLAMSVIELFCAVGLVLPAINKSFGLLAPIAAIVIAAEMLIFCALHVASGSGDQGELVYWLAVAAVCAFVAYGRLALRPF